MMLVARPGGAARTLAAGLGYPWLVMNSQRVLGAGPGAPPACFLGNAVLCLAAACQAEVCACR